MKLTKIKLLPLIISIFSCSVYASDQDGITLESQKTSQTQTSPLKFDDSSPSIKPASSPQQIESKDKAPPLKTEKSKPQQLSVQSKSIDKTFEKAVTKDSTTPTSEIVSEEKNATPFSPQEKVDIDYIQLLNKDFVKAFNNSDLKEIQNLSKKNIFNISIAQKSNIGIPENLDLFVSNLSDYKFTDFKLNEPISLEIINGYANIVGTGSAQTFINKSEKQIQFKYSATLSKEGGSWVYTSFHFAVNPDDLIQANSQLPLNLMVIALSLGILLGSLMSALLLKVKKSAN